ncbi:MAG: PEP-CTERM sorting domain-containing protein [Akkermansia sp.]|nr:PEP-CTERM sorting domain-containing protein [Akkermansia sp.]
MKKTIITLMALASVAYAADLSSSAANTWLQTYLPKIYTDGDSFTLNFSIESMTDEGYYASDMLKMASDYYVLIQHGDYIALSAKDNEGKTSTNADVTWVTPNSTVSNVNTFNVTGKACQWISFANNGSTRLGQNDGDFSLANGSLTLTYVAGGQSVLEIYSANKSVTEKVVFESGTLTLNAKDLALDMMTISNATFSTGGKTYMIGAAVPEPTTATLSLLALAGLAARRRRK